MAFKRKRLYKRKTAKRSARSMYSRKSGYKTRMASVSRRLPPMPTPALAPRDDTIAYVNCLLRPFTSPAVRIPDMISYPSCVCTLLARFAVTTIASSGAFNMNVRVYPMLGASGSGLQRKADVATAYTGQDIEGGTFIYDQAGEEVRSLANSYRCVAMGVRITPTSASDGRNGLVYCSQQVDTETFPNSTMIDRDSDIDTQVYDVATTDWATKFWIWRPDSFADLDYRDRSATNFEPSLNFHMTGTTAQSFLFEAVTHYEYIPGSSSRALLETKVVLGDINTAVRLRSALENKAGKLSTTVAVGAVPAVRQALAAVGAMSRQVLRAVPKAGGAKSLK